MTTDVGKCRRILDTVKRTGNHVTVTFNYRSAPNCVLPCPVTLTSRVFRYNPVHELVKRTLTDGRIGNGELDTPEMCSC